MESMPTIYCVRESGRERVRKIGSECWEYILVKLGTHCNERTKSTLESVRKVLHIEFRVNNTERRESTLVSVGKVLQRV